MDKSRLQDLGLSEGECEVYLSLFKLKDATVIDLAKSTGRHRTHIYDTLEKLKEKGLVSESVVDNRRSFTASSPENLLDYVKEKEETAHSLIKELKLLQTPPKSSLHVEVYKGFPGLKSVLRDILREKQDCIGYGEGTRFGKVLPIFYDQFRREAEKLHIHTKLILKKGVSVPERKGLEVRYLDYTSPSTTFVYAHKVVIIIWEPFPTAIKISDAQTSQSYKNYFELLWKVAKP